MITIYKHKLQGNGASSWHIDVHDAATGQEATSQNRISRELVFVDPLALVIPEVWTVELIDAQSVDFYAPYNLIISSSSNVLNSPDIQVKDDTVTYQFGNTISAGSKITVNSSTASVINLNILR
jgi:hypothetical protein